MSLTLSTAVSDKSSDADCHIFLGLQVRSQARYGASRYLVSVMHRLTGAVRRNLEEPGVEGVHRAREARGSAAQGVEGDEAQAGRGGPRLSSILDFMTDSYYVLWVQRNVCSTAYFLGLFTVPPTD